MHGKKGLSKMTSGTVTLQFMDSENQEAVNDDFLTMGYYCTWILRYPSTKKASNMGLTPQ